MVHRTRFSSWARVPLLAVGVLVVLPALIGRAQQSPLPPQQPGVPPQQGGGPPIFKSGVDLVLVDVQILDNEGSPILNLKPADFQVFINGHPRQVVSADFIKYATGPRQVQAEPGSTVYNPGSEDIAPEAPRGRIMVVALDDTSFFMNEMRPAIKAAQRFIDRTQPEDLVGVFTYPIGPNHVDLNHDHLSVEHALDGVQGLREPVQRLSQDELSPSEIIDITGGDQSVYQAVVARECPVVGGQFNAVTSGVVTPLGLAGGACAEGIGPDAAEMSGYLATQAAASMGRLRVLFAGMSTLPYRKTVVVVSGGLVASDKVSGRPDVDSDAKTLGRIASAAGVNLYIIHLDTSYFDSMDMSGAQSQKLDIMGMSGLRQSRETQVNAMGLERVAGEAGAGFFTITAGTGDTIFDRVLRETAAYYLLGVAPVDEDRDGKLHFVRVTVDAPHATVRSRTEVIVPRKAVQ